MGDQVRSKEKPESVSVWPLFKNSFHEALLTIPVEVKNFIGHLIYFPFFINPK